MVSLDSDFQSPGNLKYNMKHVYFFTFLMVLSTSCLKEKAVKPIVFSEACTDTVKFSTIQTNIINLSCNVAGCHDNSNNGNLPLTSHALIESNADIILKAISHENGYPAMPYGQDKLSDTLIQEFKCWIEQGKLNN